MIYPGRSSDAHFLALPCLLPHMHCSCSSPPTRALPCIPCTSGRQNGISVSSAQPCGALPCHHVAACTSATLSPLPSLPTACPPAAHPGGVALWAFESALPGVADLNPISGSFAGTVAFDPTATGVGMLLENMMAYFNVHSVAVSTVGLEEPGV